MDNNKQLLSNRIKGLNRGRGFCCIVIVLLLLCVTNIFSQNTNISGTITDNSGKVIIGVNVLIKDTNSSTQTDKDGVYEIEAKKGDILIFSMVGFANQEIEVGENVLINVQLETAIETETESVSETEQMKEVVVIGYGVQKKGEITSSIASVKSDNFVKGSVQDPAQLIQGKVAGLNVSAPSGDPTAGTQIMLRGVGSLMSNTYPLVIIDGVPGDFNSVAAEDIETIDVIKDGSAAAIYGTRGNNGVIFITTKKVKGDIKATIDVHSYLTVKQISNKVNMMSASQYRELVKNGVPGAVDYGYSTDWLDEILQTPFSSVTNVGLKGGNKSSNYIVNLNFKGSNGIVKRTDNNVFTQRIEVNHGMFDNKLKFNLNLMGQNQKYQALGDGSSFNSQIYKQGLQTIPTDGVKDEQGNWIERTSRNEYFNPVAQIYETEGENKNTTLKSFGSVTYAPVKQVFLKALVSTNTTNQTRGYYETKKNISTVKNGKNGFASRGTSVWDENLLELTAQYRETFDKHNVTGLLGYSYQDNMYENYWMQNWDFPTDDFTYNNMDAGAARKRGIAPTSSYKESSKLIGFFGRVNYDFNSRYLLSFSLRREGSSKFGEDNKWGNFPAASVGWNIKKESFMENLKTLSSLKLRLGFGITGSIPNDNYISLKKMSTGSNFYNNGNWESTLKAASNANPNLKWEKKEEWNFGIDFGFLSNRLNGALDVYQRTTTDMLWTYQVPMPPYLYSSIIANAGTMQNKGLEIHLEGIVIQTKNLEWVSTINYSTNRNKLVSLSNDDFKIISGFIDAGSTDEPIQQSTHRLYEGGVVGNFYGYKSVDVDPSGRWIIQGADGNPKPISDQQPEDKTVIGNGLPKHFLSWNNTVKFKNFDFTVLMRGAFDYQIINSPRMFYETPAAVFRGNAMQNAFQPVYGKVPLSSQQEMQYVSYFVEDGDFWKIDNITLGYNFKIKRGIQNLRIYASGSNLFTFTNYSGIDPEVNMQGLNPGYDERFTYPSTRSFSVGAMVTF